MEIRELLAEIAPVGVHTQVSAGANRHGKAYGALTFGTARELETFFKTELIGNPIMKGYSSKAVGTTLLIWKR